MVFLTVIQNLWQQWINLIFFVDTKTQKWINFIIFVCTQKLKNESLKLF